eukprot:NODE_5_length_4757_cov_5.951836.p1 GENE.NODE_5_length_4757_cov_5.951836~~NODE_5_length_4757_cov_5.951836.p1  ORF type:complete len:1291 (+),score=199.12 NODE_5_length_4757_cov_5.951836:128-4000(+)
MGRWDVTLPFLSPGRGTSSAVAASPRQLLAGAGRSGSRSPSFSSGSDDGANHSNLPNTEDIYDLPTSQLAALEERLRPIAAAAGGTAREARLYGLIRAELSERRGIEEIGLALVGGRFDLNRAMAAVSAFPVAAATPAEPPAERVVAASGHPHCSGAAHPHCSGATPTAVEQAKERLERPPPLQWSSAPSPSTYSSRRLMTPPSPRSPPSVRLADQERNRTEYGGATGSSATAAARLRDFKPTPVDFDFVIGRSSVKKQKSQPKKKAAAKDSEAGRPPRAPARRTSAPQRQGSRAPSKPGASQQAAVRAGRSASTGAGQRSSSLDARACPALLRSRAHSSGPGSSDGFVSCPDDNLVAEVEASGPELSSLDRCVSSPFLACVDPVTLETQPTTETPTRSSGPRLGTASPIEPNFNEAIPDAGTASPIEPNFNEAIPDAGADTDDNTNSGEDTARPASISSYRGCSSHHVPEEMGYLENSSLPEEEGWKADGVVFEERCQGSTSPGRCESSSATSPALVVAAARRAQHLPPWAPSPEGWESCEASSPPMLADTSSPTPADCTEGRASSSQGVRCTATPPNAKLRAASLSPPRSEASVYASDAAEYIVEPGDVGDLVSRSADCATLISVDDPNCGAPTLHPPSPQTAAALSPVTARIMQPKSEESKRATRRPPRPPLQRGRDAAPRDVAPRVRPGELDLLGLDPKVVEAGLIRSQAEAFPTFTSFFSWGLSQSGDALLHRDRYLQEALQFFTLFCDIMGSLECQFNDELATVDHATPNATQQAISAMGTRGAGLYGVFLRGVIDKIPNPQPQIEKPVALPCSSCPRDVFGLRYYKVVQSRAEVYDIVTRMLHQKDGWEELPHGLGLGNTWNLCWTWSKPKVDYSRLCVWQKINHFPDNKHLTRKDCLKRSIDRYIKSGGRAAQYFNVCPKTFVLPKEYCLFLDCFAKTAESNDCIEEENGSARKQKSLNIWIMKPAASSRGRGIQVVNDVGSVHYGELTIIQQYIENPYLLGGFKWDMRVYVTVTSFNPLEAFLYKEGFARVTTVPYSTKPEDLTNKFVHLTNSSIQRYNDDANLNSDPCDAEALARQKDAVIGGTKISFAMLRERLKQQNVSWSLVWSRMIEVIIKSLCMAEDHIPNQVNSFELFGYDLLLDTNMKVWLIEVNSSPSMGLEHLLDEQIKLPLISDTIDLVEPLVFDRKKLAEVLQRRITKKMTVGAAGGRQQLDVDVHAILRGATVRKHGEMPKKMGNYECIAPGEIYDVVNQSRTSLFSRRPGVTAAVPEAAPARSEPLQ